MTQHPPGANGVPLTLPADFDLTAAVAEMMEQHWVEPGYCAPNATTYPWQWLWDSCFHALIWTALGDERGVIELETLLSTTTTDGFVPHMNYARDPQQSVDYWGRAGASSITQPPMYGHALAEMLRRGVDIPDRLIDTAATALGHLFDARHRTEGLLHIVHPWETGADDSPRWDHFCPGGYERQRWGVTKTELLASIVTNEAASPVTNPAFEVAAVSFSALVAFNAREIAGVIGDAQLSAQADELAQAIEARWDADLVSWVDAGAAENTTGRVRSLDAMTALLVVEPGEATRAAMDSLVDPQAFGARHGPCGVHRQEPFFDPVTYWRGPSWPQLSYLMWVAALRLDSPHAAALGASLVSGSSVSGLAEYWHPDTGAGGGAIPQTWTGLGIVVGR
jgi:hypothetical protein